MKVFGITVTILGVLACIVAVGTAANAPWGENPGLDVIGIAIAGVGIVFAGATLLQHSK